MFEFPWLSLQFTLSSLSVTVSASVVTFLIQVGYFVIYTVLCNDSSLDTLKDVCCVRLSVTLAGNVLCLSLLASQKKVFEVALAVP